MKIKLGSTVNISFDAIDHLECTVTDVQKEEVLLSFWAPKSMFKEADDAAED